ncbi:MAG: anthranilate synthase component II [Planctomycetota bacterium]|jgi:anthranilate synthase/aminodeoxychorismate synthase-like glutamine amidotransferase
MILLIDNYDSFTWNLVQRIGEIDSSIELRVVRNDEISPDQIDSLSPSHIILSPGPCTPNEAGITNDVVSSFAGKIPILGVCLGHQCIGFSHGMTVARHAKLMHGKTSQINHDAKGIYEGLPNPVIMTRYHSLVITRDTVPDNGWEVSAWCMDDFEDGTVAEVIMGVRKVWDDPSKAPLEGVQFHPESFLSHHGPWLLANFLGLPRPALPEVQYTS